MITAPNVRSMLEFSFIIQKLKRKRLCSEEAKGSPSLNESGSLLLLSGSRSLGLRGGICLMYTQKAQLLKKLISYEGTPGHTDPGLPPVELLL